MTAPSDDAPESGGASSVNAPASLVAPPDSPGYRTPDLVLRRTSRETRPPVRLQDFVTYQTKVLEYISLAEDLMKLDLDGVSKALDLISDALSSCSHSNRLMEMKANALLKLRRYEDAIRYCELTPDSDGKDYISKQWRLNVIAKSYFYSGKLDEALEAIKRNEQATVDSEWYEFDSSSSETEKEFELNENKAPEPDITFLVTLRELAHLKTAGNEAFHATRYAEAVEHYSAAIALSTESRFFTAVCLCSRAAAYQAMCHIVNAIADCSLAIALDPTHTKAFSRRAVLYDMIRDYNQEANDLRMLISLLEKQQQENQTGKSSKTNTSDYLNRVHRRLLSAEDSTKKSIPLNFYLILGVDDTASEDDVKNAYDKAALRHRPDMVIQSLPKNEMVDGDAISIEITGRVHKDADHLFEIIGEAYAVLSDTTKRAKYDSDEEKRQTKKTYGTVSTPRKSPLGG
ncbi:DnaJ [Rhynchospora pubera]|uniref:DnaJ n=1 Tax=Rhynchospora pubera TaxID=906938 RepID=A0AAV8H2S7_9POAL|nr:DnaJ [Rhynchospora pubera]